MKAENSTENTIEPLNLAVSVKKNTWRWQFVFLAFVVSIGAIGLVIKKLNVSSVKRDDGTRIVSLPILKTVPYPSDSANQPGERWYDPVPAQEMQPQSLSSSSNQWCDGDETICTTATTAKPIETLKKLIAAIPQDKAKQYKIYLSVTPLQVEEEAIDDAAK
jgi:hypothetical protein